MAEDKIAEQFIELMLRTMQTFADMFAAAMQRGTEESRARLQLKAAEETIKDLKAGVIPAFYKVHDAQVVEVAHRLEAAGVPYNIHQTQTEKPVTYITVPIAHADKMDAVIKDFNDDMHANMRMTPSDFDAMFHDPVDIVLNKEQSIEFEQMMINFGRNIPYAIYTKTDGVHTYDMVRFREEDAVRINEIMNEMNWRFKVDPSYKELRAFEKREIEKLDAALRTRDQKLTAVSHQDPSKQIEIDGNEWSYKKNGIIVEHGTAAEAGRLKYCLKALQTAVVFRTDRMPKEQGLLKEEMDRLVPKLSYSMEMTLKRFAVHGFDQLKFERAGDIESGKPLAETDRIRVSGLTDMEIAHVQRVFLDKGLLRELSGTQVERTDEETNKSVMVKALEFPAKEYTLVRNEILKARSLTHILQDKGLYQAEANQMALMNSFHRVARNGQAMILYAKNGTVTIEPNPGDKEHIRMRSGDNPDYTLIDRKDWWQMMDKGRERVEKMQVFNSSRELELTKRTEKEDIQTSRDFAEALKSGRALVPAADPADMDVHAAYFTKGEKDGTAMIHEYDRGKWKEYEMTSENAFRIAKGVSGEIRSMNENLTNDFRMDPAVIRSSAAGSLTMDRQMIEKTVSHSQLLFNLEKAGKEKGEEVFMQDEKNGFDYGELVSGIQRGEVQDEITPVRVNEMSFVETILSQADEIRYNETIAREEDIDFGAFDR